MTYAPTQFHKGTQPRPNVYKRSFEARDTTDAFMLAAAGIEPKVKVAWWRKLKIWELGLLVLGAIGVIVMVLR